MLLFLIQQVGKVDSTHIKTLSDHLSAGEWIALCALFVTIIGGIGWIIFNTGSTYSDVKSMKPLVAKMPDMGGKNRYIVGRKSLKS